MTSEEVLRAAHCWFDVDRADTPTMTDFKREARYRQHLWALNLDGVEFGTHRGRGGVDKPNGTKLDDASAERGLNFLSDAVESAVHDRLESPQDRQTLDARRLHRDLLSSMPMAFNLFAEAREHEASQRALTQVLAPDLGAQPAQVTFEWSPGRGDTEYTGDRTAFDVALALGDAPPTVIGIETKYHEHAMRETKPTNAARVRADEQTAFLVELAERSGVFRSGWQDAVLETSLRQIWRDHLLALSMRQHSERWGSGTRYVLVYPERNASFAAAGSAYAELLLDGEASFAARTIEQLVDAAFTHDEGMARRFRERYLW